MNTTDPATGTASDTTVDTAPPTAAARASFLDRLTAAMLSTRIARPAEGRIIGGVCVGLGHRFGVDPVLIRVAFVVLSVAGGAGLPLYLGLLLVLPDDYGRLALVKGLRSGDAGALALTVGFLAVLFSPSMIPSDDNPWIDTLATAGLVGVCAWLVFRNRPAPGTYEQPPVPAGPLVFDPDTSTWVEAGTPTRDEAGTRPAPAPGGSTAEPRRRRHRTARRTAWRSFAVALGSFTITCLLGMALGVPDAVLLACMVMLACLGVTLVIHGRRGIRNVTAAVLACAALAATPLLINNPATIDPGTLSVTTDSSSGQGVGEKVARPLTAAEVESSLSLGAGPLTLDLTGLPASEWASLHSVPVDIEVGTGEITVLVPQGRSVVVRAESGVGDVTVEPLGSAPSLHSGLSVKTTATIGTGTPALVIDAHVGAGGIIVKEQ